MSNDNDSATKLSILEMNLEVATSSRKQWELTLGKSEYDLEHTKAQLRLAELTEEVFKEAIEKFKDANRDS